MPISITPLLTKQLENRNCIGVKGMKTKVLIFIYKVLVPYLMNYQGWAVFMDFDILCRTDISKLSNLYDDKFSLLCVKHNHLPNEKVKFQGEKQTSYPKKNWSSFMIFNCSKCKSLSLDYVNNASGLRSP